MNGTVAQAAQAAMTDVLTAVAGELALAQSQCARLDGALGQLLHAAPAEQRGAVMRELHVVDLLNQQIGAVAAFVEHLSTELPHGARVAVGPALGTITLGEVAERIGLGVGYAAPVPTQADDAVDFF
jgi:hypothetical protein